MMRRATGCFLFLFILFAILSHANEFTLRLSKNFIQMKYILNTVRLVSVFASQSSFLKGILPGLNSE